MGEDRKKYQYGEQLSGLVGAENRWMAFARRYPRQISTLLNQLEHERGRSRYIAL